VNGKSYCRTLDRFSNIPALKKGLVARFVCGKDTAIFPRIAKEFGVDMTHEVTEDGCRITLKLK
jgi:hypothetical protein